MAITIKKIAEICNISRGTVDRVLNNRGKVKPETEVFIRKIAEQMGYEPNPAGKALAAKKKKLVIGVLLVSEGNPFFDEVIRGIRATGIEYVAYGVRVSIKTMCGYDVKRQCELMDEMKSEVNALIINPISDIRVCNKINELVDHGIFVVTVNTDIANSKRACFVGSDYTNGGETACGIMGLLMKGHAKVGVVTGSFKVSGHNQRIAGFKKIMKKKYPGFQLLEIVESEDDDIRAFEVTTKLLQKYEQMDAVFIVAGGVYGVCRALIGQERDQKITVVSFDSAPTTVEMMERHVVDVTIYQHPYTQGREAMQVVFAYLVNGATPKKERHILKNEIKVLENL